MGGESQGFHLCTVYQENVVSTYKRRETKARGEGLPRQRAWPVKRPCDGNQPSELSSSSNQLQ